MALSIGLTARSELERRRCLNRNNRKPWDTLTQAKGRILEMVWTPHVNAGLRLSAVKFMQRVILVQTRGVNDPRVRSLNRIALLTLSSDACWYAAAKQR